MSITKYVCEECGESFKEPEFYLSDDLGECPFCRSECIEQVIVPTQDEIHAKDDEMHAASLAWRAMSEAERDALRAKADAHLERVGR